MNAPTVAGPHEGLLRWLREHGVDHEIHEHVEAFTAARTASSEGVDARTFAKVVGVRTDDGRNALLVIDAPELIDLHKARSALGAKDVRLLEESELASLTPGCESGAVPAVGGLFGLLMLADYAVGDDAEISFNAGTHRHTVRVDRAGWEQAAAVQYADLARDEDDAPPWASS